MKPLVSICIPNYNYEKFIGETIDSVLAQSYDNFEVIISDNCSTDSSMDIINSYNDSRIKVYQNSENINLYENINKAISLSNGELICVIHSDDMYAPDFLEKVVDSYEKYPDKKVFITGVYNYHHVQNKAIPHHPFETEGVKSQKELLIRLQSVNIIGNGVNVVLHKDCIEHAGMYSSTYRYASDYDYWLRLAECFDFVYIPEFLAYYRIHSFNLSHKVNKNLDMFKEGFDILNKNMSKSKIIDDELFEEVKGYRCRNLFQKCWKMGYKYRSGRLMRNMLDCSAQELPQLKNYPYFSLLKFISVFMFENMPLFYLIPFSYLFRALLYCNNISIKKDLEKLVKKHCKTFKSFDKEKELTLSKC